MKLTLVRHGQTEWNAGRRFQGHSDIPLSEIGRAQAAQASLALDFEQFDVAYSSDLARAVETAEIIAAPHGLAVQQDARLREFNFGEWEGLTWPEITERYPEFRDTAFSAATLYRPVGGETFDDVQARVQAFLDDLQKCGYEHVLVVTHAGVLHAIVDGLAESGSFAQASITRMTMDKDRIRLITLNDVSHLYTAS